MKRAVLLMHALLVPAMLTALTAHAAEPTQQLRWISADDVRVRSGPSGQHKVTGTLLRGAEVTVGSTESDGYCHIDGEGHNGYVACRYLSAQRVARRKAGEDGIDASQRWVAGNSVVVREAPHRDAPVASRMSVNTIVKLVRQDAGNGYCEVELPGGRTGFTGCVYLATTPVILAQIRGHRHSDDPPPPGYDPVRAFWLEPSWAALEAYAEHLQRRRPDTPSHGPWPRDEALERMKAHLAMGLKGPKPGSYADWSRLKREAAKGVDATGGLHAATGLAGWLSQAGATTDGGTGQMVALVRALEFPEVTPSFFRSDSEIAPPLSSAEEASGRFDIVFRQVVTPRPKRKPRAEDETGAGVYDMLARTQLLVKPVKRVRLFRDGRVASEPSLIRSKTTLWGSNVDAPMCWGWTPGFSFGAADARIWRYFATEAAAMRKMNKAPAGSLYMFYTTTDLPAGSALTTATPMTLNRGATGFVRGVRLTYDLDRDGVPDIAVWEGEGKGPGHMDPTTTDDKWYRLVLVNIAGAWKVLGTDTFDYGCGC